MNNVLLIWEEVPESTKVYFLTDLTDEEFEKVKKCHGKFCNCSGVPETLWLNQYLEDKSSLVDTAVEPPGTAPILDSRHGMLIVVSGFVL